MSSDREIRRLRRLALREQGLESGQDSESEETFHDTVPPLNLEDSGEAEEVLESSHFGEQLETSNDVIIVEYDGNGIPVVIGSIPEVQSDGNGEGENSENVNNPEFVNSISSSDSDLEMAFKFGNFGHFDETKEDIESYLSRLKSAMVVGKVAEDHKVHALISSLGPEAYCTLRNLCAPTDPAEKSFDDCAKLLLEHYVDVSLLSVQHFKLDNRIQQPDESVAKYAEALRFLARSCKFADSNAMNIYLANVFPRNLRDDRIKMIVIPENLGFEDCVKRAKALETTYAQISLVNTKVSDTTSGGTSAQASAMEGNTSAVHALRYKTSGNSDTRRDLGRHRGGSRELRRDEAREYRQWTPRQREAVSCWRCGGSNHSQDSCWCRQMRCYSCSETGHLSRVCYKARKKERKLKENKQNKQSKYKKGGKIHFTADKGEQVSTDDSDSESGDSDTAINVICSVKKSGVDFSINCSVNNTDLIMQVDTCADVSIIPYEIFIDKFPDLKLNKSTDHLSTYGGKVLKIIGECSVDVSYRDKIYNDLSLIVVEANRNQPILFGKNWLRVIQLDWSSFFCVNIAKKKSKKSKFKNNLKQKSDYEMPNKDLHKKTVAKLKESFPTVFDKNIGMIKDFECHIQVREDATPRFSKAYEVPYALIDKFEKELSEHVKQGILKPVSYSDWASPLVPVKKPDGGLRICGDYKATLNPCLLTDQYPLPVFSEMSQKWVGCRYFSKIDLKKAYLQLNVHKDSQKYLTVNTHKGLFQYTRLVYGVASAPALFQQTMDQILSGLKGVTCYIDDVLVAGRTLDQAERRLHRVINRLAKFNVRVNLSKCIFLQETVEYIGHKVDSQGLHPLPCKVNALKNAPIPTSADELGTFLGVLNYYHEFIPMLSAVAQPLYEAANKADWVWSHDLTVCYQKVKDLLTSDLLLVPYDPAKPIIVTADASPKGVGGVLSLLENGKERPVMFTSRTLSKAELKYSQIEKEALALVFTLKKFHKYLYGRKFTLFTDHKPLTFIFDVNKNIPSLSRARIQRWALIMSAYQYDLKFRKGVDNVPADLLSRLPIPEPDSFHAVLYCDLIPSPIPLNFVEIAKETKADPILVKVKALTLTGWPDENTDINLTPYWSRRLELSLEKDCVLWGNRVVIPKKLQSDILNLLHSNHPGISRMKALARSILWFPNIDNQIEQLVKHCEICMLTQNANPQHTVSWPKTERFFQRVMWTLVNLKVQIS